MPINNTKLTRLDILKFFTLMGAAAFLPKSLFANFNDQPTIHFVGFGGAGSNLVEYFQSKGVQGKFTCISDPIRSNISKEIQFIHFVPPGTSVFKNGAEIYRASDMEQKITIPRSVLDIFTSNDRFVLLSGLGGYTGTYMTEELTLKLSQEGKRFTSIATLPFDYEGSRKISIAQNTINKLKHIDGFKSYALDNTRKYGNLYRSKAFEIAHEEIYGMYEDFVF